MFRIVFNLFFTIASLSAFGQQVQWVKTYEFEPWESFGDKIVQLEDSTYTAICRIGAFGYHNVNMIYGLGLMRLDKNGDTLFVKKLWGSSSGTGNSLTKTDDFNLLIGVTIFRDTAFNARMRIIKCDYDGIMHWMYNYIGDEWLNASMRKVIQARDGGCYAIGSAKGLLSGNSQDMFLTRLDANGMHEWTNWYSGGSYTTGQNIEEMPDGNYLLSGGADAGIWSVVVDSNGTQLSQKTWYSNASLGTIYPSGAGVKQGVNGGFYVYGSHVNPNSNWSAIRRYDADTNLIFERILPVGTDQPIELSDDGGFVRMERTLGQAAKFVKRNGQGDIAWTITVGTAEGGYGFNGLAYDGLGSAVIAGTKADPYANVYFLKISNVGYPVDPLSAKPKVETQKGKGPELIAYPNPCQQFFYLQGIKGKTNVALYTLQGQQLGSYTIRPNDAIPAWKLQPGIYVWKAEVGGKVFTGKMIKE